MLEATERQIEILQSIVDFKKIKEYSPTFREIADINGITVKSAADHVSALERKGYISSEQGKSRSIKVLRLPEKVA